MPWFPYDPILLVEPGIVRKIRIQSLGAYHGFIIQNRDSGVDLLLSLVCVCLASCVFQQSQTVWIGTDCGRTVFTKATSFRLDWINSAKQTRSCQTVQIKSQGIAIVPSFTSEEKFGDMPTWMTSATVVSWSSRSNDCKICRGKHTRYLHPPYAFVRKQKSFHGFVLSIVSIHPAAVTATAVDDVDLQSVSNSPLISQQISYILVAVVEEVLIEANEVGVICLSASPKRRFRCQARNDEE